MNHFLFLFRKMGSHPGDKCLTEREGPAQGLDVFSLLSWPISGIPLPARAGFSVPSNVRAEGKNEAERVSKHIIKGSSSMRGQRG